MLAGIAAAARRVFGALKIDTVVIRGRNDDELTALIDFGRTVDAEVRFIEYMDVGGATAGRWTPSSRAREMLERLVAHVRPDRAAGGSVHRRRRSASGCRTARRSGSSRRRRSRSARACDRSRLTADGLWLLCLYARGGARSAASAARGRQPRGTRAIWSRPCGRCARIAARRNASESPAPRRPHPGGGAEARRASRDAHARRLAAHRDDWIDTRGPPRRHGSGEHTGRRQNPGNHRHGGGIARRNLEQHRPQE